MSAAEASLDAPARRVEFGCDVAAWRGRLGLAERAAALRLGVTTETLARIERRRVDPDELGPKTLTRIRHVLSEGALVPTPDPREFSREFRRDGGAHPPGGGGGAADGGGAVPRGAPSEGGGAFFDASPPGRTVRGDSGTATVSFRKLVESYAVELVLAIPAIGGRNMAFTPAAAIELGRALIDHGELAEAE